MLGDETLEPSFGCLFVAPGVLTFVTNRTPHGPRIIALAPQLSQAVGNNLGCSRPIHRIGISADYSRYEV